MKPKQIIYLAVALLAIVAAGLWMDRTAGTTGAGGTVASDATIRPSAPAVTRDALSYTGFIEKVREGSIAQVTVSQSALTARTGDTIYSAAIPPGAPAVRQLMAAGADITAAPSAREGGLFSNPLLLWIPVVLLIGGIVYMVRRRAGGGRGGKAKAEVGKSTAKLLTQDSRKALFSDVAGCDEAKLEISEVVDFLKDPSRYTDVGGQIPRGVLLSGPPGTGKTLLARAVAGEAGVPFYTASGSSFTEMYVGVGASRVRDMFEEAKKNAPCIVFIDEVDTVGRKRNAGMAGGNEEREQTLNQLLAEMDGFETNEGVILIAATNMPEALDPALTRPGRFDRQVTVPNPDVRGREQILKVHAGRVPLSGDVCLRRIARSTPGFSGADLSNLINEAALLAARAGDKQVTSRHVEQAGDKVRMGAERRGLVMSEHDRRLIAFHEAGHAIVGMYVPGNDPLHKVTIIPRGQAMGFAMWVPAGDRWGHSLQELTGRIAMAYGGRVAEEIVFGRAHVTSGAQGDIRQASQMARKMVLEWGMSEKVGLIDYGQDPATGRPPDMSPQARQEIDDEIRRILAEGEATARKALADRSEEFHNLAEALLEHETLDAHEIDRVVQGQPPYRPEPVRTRAQDGGPAAESAGADVEGVEPARA